MTGLFSLHGFKETVAHLRAVIASTPFMYGTKERDDYLVRDLSTLPRYGHLARLAMFHYGGKHYDPRTIPYTIEIDLRRFIRDAIQYKVVFRTGGYDWEWLDNFFKKYIGEALGIAIPYDAQLLKEESRWKFQAQFLNDAERPV